MPIKDRDFGKYKRPGIFMEEIDSSVIQLPVQDVLINLVPGFSKKGPFNAPIYVTNPSDFISIFGDDDRRLENKGSFFHKTVKQMLKSGPVWALNLLATNPNRDKVDWQSISVSSSYPNGDIKRAPYEAFFNRQDFWERDSESFLNLVKNSNYGIEDKQRLFHITNMSDKDITVFMFKSDVTGFDVTAEEWYGDRTKVPAYMHYKDWISDYMVKVIVLAGDWSDYKTLSNDSTFGKYFNRSGLMTDQVAGFLKERIVNVLGKYDVSLVPHFKDLDNRDLYIKNIINNNTDKTGLFCTYNENLLLEADYKLESLDVIGDVIAGGKMVDGVWTDVTDINFMSYETSLKEKMTYSKKLLDSENNVFTNYVDNLCYGGIGGNLRSANYMNGNIQDIFFAGLTLSGNTVDITDDSVSGAKGNILSVKFSGSTGAAYYVLDGTLITGFTEDSINIDYNNITELGSRTDVLYLTSDKKVNILYGTPSNNSGSTNPDYPYSLNETIILGKVNIISSATGITATYIPITTSGEKSFISPFVGDYDISVSGEYDTLGSYLKLTFNGTNGKYGEYNDYQYLRVINYFYEAYDNITTKSVLIQPSLSGFSSGFTTKADVGAVMQFEPKSNSAAFIKIYVKEPTKYIFTEENINYFLLYYVDDEFIILDSALTGSLKTLNDEPVANEEDSVGIVAKYSKFYLDYYNGNINNLDYFYVNNTQLERVFLKMFLDQYDNLNVNFLSTYNPDTPTNIERFKSEYDSKIEVYSNKRNWQQSVEIEDWYGEDLTTCQEIYVDKERYSEITRGSYLAAYYDEEYYRAPSGDGYLLGAVPRKLARVINVKNDVNNVNLKILYTDAPIKISNYNLDTSTGITQVDLQTFTYPSIDKYVSEYKALKLKPFVVHPDSIPDGTARRQHDILNVLSKDKNLAKGLANKNKISWRYLIDSFGLGLEPVDNIFPKQQFADICGLKLNCLGFLNMPSARQFKESVNPSFTNTDGSLNLEFIRKGADESKNPDYLYQFAQQHGDIDGRSCVGYFFPYVRIYDNGIPKLVPPAAYVATTYMQKFTSNVAGLVPWTIAAGITNGRINGITKTEMDFTDEDLEHLYQMNANPIVYKVNNGYCINSESTAQVFPYSSLSFLHSREVLIELENRMYDMLLTYQWQFNTAEIRAEIKYKADKICREMLENDAFYDFWNVCDETNNTDYVIDLQIGVLDTYVEVIKGMGIIVNNITIMKKGDIKSGGFK